jgi:hypothetical protein
LGDADGGRCACWAAHDRIQVADTHINFLIREDYGEELETKISTSFIEQAPVGWAHLSEPRTL